MRINNNFDNLTEKHLLHKQFVAWSCDGSSVAPVRRKSSKRQKCGVFPFGLIASATAPPVGEVVKPIFNKSFFGGGGVGVKEEKKTMR